MYTGRVVNNNKSSEITEQKQQQQQQQHQQEEEEVNFPAEEVDINTVMSLLLLSTRLGFTALSQRCETIISAHLYEYFPANVNNCLVFANNYNLVRLEAQCRDILDRN